MGDSAFVDQALASYLAASGSAESEELGELLASRAGPVIRKVVFRRIRESRPDAEDVCAEAIVHLMVRLQRSKEEQDADPIRDFMNYAAAIAHHACDQYWRRRNPALWRLRNRIRYLLEHDSKLAVWRNSENVALCGLAAWKSRSRVETTPSPDDLAGANRLPLPELLFEVFRRSRGPLELHDVVEIVRSVSGIAARIGEDSEALEQLAGPNPAIDLEIEQRAHAAELWKEIQDLPPRQRHALLLNLKDDALNLLLLREVASFRQIAAALQMEPEGLASLWNQLPLEDTGVAQRLGCTRQQVINLRMAARKRLANRLAGWS